MRAWSDRNPEAAALFNPAFSAALLLFGTKAYVKARPSGMPFAESFLILPFGLNRFLRTCLPRTTVTPLHVWVSRVPEVKIRLAQRVGNLVPVTRESLLFLLQRRILGLEGDTLHLVKGSLRGLREMQEDEEFTELFEGSRLISIMLAKVGSTVDAFSALGLTL